MFLVSIIGIGNTIGRVVCGLASSIPGVDALMVNNIFISIGGLLTIFSGLSASEEYQFFYSAAFGLSICEYLFTTKKNYFYYKKYSLKNIYIYLNNKGLTEVGLKIILKTL